MDISVLQSHSVALALEMTGDRTEMLERSLSALGDVGIPDKANIFPSQLSGGEQQRVAIVRALVKKPEIVLADEPTGNLDQVTSGKIADLMGRICRTEKITFIVVSHDTSITRVADRVLHLHDGRIVEENVI